MHPIQTTPDDANLRSTSGVPTGRPGLAGVAGMAAGVDAATDDQYTVEQMTKSGRHLLLVVVAADTRDQLTGSAAGDFVCKAARLVGHKVLGLSETPHPYPVDVASPAGRFRAEFRVALDM